MTRLAVEAFAKVNRSLLVLGKRADGYHELDTLFQTIDLSDRLEIHDSDDLSLTTDDPRLPVGEVNLVIRAARALARAAGVPARAEMHLEKRIPSGAGLGGGSSDAAATLLGLRALWGLALDEAELSRIGSELGSDVPFFLHGGLARGTGRGERIEPLPDPPVEWLVLLSPPFGLSTPQVYRRLALPAAGSPGGSLTGRPAPSNLAGSDLGGFPDRNDLEPAAESLRGEVRLLRLSLVGVGAAQVRLSGSGSTVFGVFRNEEEARAAARKLDELPADTGIRVVPTLGREAFRERALPRAR